MGEKEGGSRMEERIPGLSDNHELTLVNREQAQISGVLHLATFDDEQVVLDTELGTLTLKGEDLHIKQLDLDAGRLSVEGLVTSVLYGPGKGRTGRQKGRGLLDRLLK
jgi:sporulation protein YabP